MTLSIAGSNQSTRTVGTVTNSGIDGESTITEGTLYLYSNKTHECVFRKVITSSMFDETTPNKTKPIKISVNSVDTEDKDTYTVYFMANKTGIEDPLATDASFAISENGGAEYGLTGESKIVMFNQNDHSRQANHSIVKFTAANNVSTNPATAVLTSSLTSSSHFKTVLLLVIIISPFILIFCFFIYISSLYFHTKPYADGTFPFKHLQIKLFTSIPTSVAEGHSRMKFPSKSYCKIGILRLFEILSFIVP